MQIFKIPTSYGGLERTGSEKAPDKIIEYLMKEIWLNENNKKPVFEVKQIDLGSETDISRIHEMISSMVSDNGIYVGGDHSITYSLFRSFLKRNPGAGIISFDAHPDVYPCYDYPTHGDWLYHLIEDGMLDPRNVIIVGVRSAAKEEIDYMKDKGIKYFPMKKIFGDIDNICDNVMELARDFASLYISIDIDSVDPSCAPGTGYIEPAGFTSRELLYFIQRLRLLKNIRAVDITEVNPEKDINGMTAKLGAKIAGEFL